MTRTADTVELCDQCGRPATYRISGATEVRCEACAIRFGYERRGDAYTAMKMLGCVLDLLRDAGLDDAAITGMVHTILTNPHSTATYPVGGDEFLPGPDVTAEQPWKTGMIPIGVTA